jgi:hypothetical protein
MEAKVTRLFKISIFCLLVCGIAGVSLANGLGGERLEKVVGDVIVDIGTDQTATPIAGEPIEFDFNLLRADTREPVGTPTSVGLDIEHNGKPMVNGDLITELPNTFLFYTFPEGGSYTLKVTFFDSHRNPPALATATFPLTISSAGSKTRILYIVPLLVCLVAAFFLGMWSARRRVPR